MYVCTYVCASILCLYRINIIIFNLTLSTFFRNEIIENDASVHAKFHIQISLVNDLYSSMTVNINLDSHLTRYCGGFKKKTTILDAVIAILFILSLTTNILSIIRTHRLAEVPMYVYTYVQSYIAIYVHT